MKRQSLRKGLVLISFLLFPVTFYYLSPYLIIMGVSQGIISGSFIIFSLMFLTSLLFGRALCGWICPAGGLQKCCNMVSGKRTKGGKLNWIKYAIWIPWISIIVFAAVYAGGFEKVDFLYQTDQGVSLSGLQAYVVYYAVVALIVILAFTAGRRSFCQYVCWMAPFMIIGSRIKEVFRTPSLKLTADGSKCVNCENCTRRCPMSLEVMDMVHNGSMQNDECILCGECADGCTQKVIKYTFSKEKRK